MQTVHPIPAVVNPQAVNWNSAPAAWVSVDQNPDRTFVWRIERTGGKLSTTGRESFADFDSAANAALSIAEAKGLPLAADVSLFIEMASPFFSGHEHEMAVDAYGPPEMMCGICGQPWSQCRCAAQKAVLK